MFHGSITVSILLNFISLFFEILMYWSSGDFSGRFRLEGESRNTFQIIVSTKCFFFKFNFVCGGFGALQPDSPRPPWVRPWL